MLLEVNTPEGKALIPHEAILSIETFPKYMRVKIYDHMRSAKSIIKVGINMHSETIYSDDTLEELRTKYEALTTTKAHA